MEAGGLIGYGINRFAQYRRAAYFVEQILRGANPGELPIEHTPVELSVNLATADALGLTIPAALLARADAVRHTAAQSLGAAPV